MNILSAANGAVLESCGTIKTWDHIGVVVAWGLRMVAQLVSGQFPLFHDYPCHATSS